MLTGKLPYPDIDDLDLLKTSMTSLKQVVLPKEANKLPKGFKKALGAMLQVDPELRPSIEQVLILIKDSVVPNSIPVTNRLIFPPDSSSTITPSSSNHPTPLDENARISLALLMVHFYSIRSYLPSVDLYKRDTHVPYNSLFSKNRPGTGFHLFSLENNKTTLGYRIANCVHLPDRCLLFQ